MTTRNCDNCKRKIKRHEGLRLITQSFFVDIELCSKCGESVTSEIINKRLLSNRLTKLLQTDHPLIEASKKLQSNN